MNKNGESIKTLQLITIILILQLIPLIQLPLNVEARDLECIDIRGGIYTVYEVNDNTILNVTYKPMNKYTKNPMINVTIHWKGKTLWAVYNLTNRIVISGKLWNWIIYPLWIPKNLKENNKIQLYDDKVFKIVKVNETVTILSDNKTTLTYDSFSGVLINGDIYLWNSTLTINLVRTNMKMRKDYFNEIYFDWQTLTIKLIELEKKYIGKLKIYSIGKSVLGREIWACEIIGSGIRREIVLIDGGMHGSEVIGVRVAYRIIELMLEDYDKLVEKGLLKDLSVIIIPMLNPDGVEMSKYSPPIPSIRLKDGRCNANGVDINRNFRYAWSMGGSSQYNSTTYRGEEPESEPEVKALINLILSHNVIFYLNLHSGIRQILIPAYQENPYINLYMEIAQLMSNIYGYEIARGGTYGGAANWCLMAKSKPTISLIIELYGGGVNTLSVDWFLFYNPVDMKEIRKIELLSYQAVIQILTNVRKWNEKLAGSISLMDQRPIIFSVVIITIAIIILYFTRKIFYGRTNERIKPQRPPNAVDIKLTI